MGGPPGAIRLHPQMARPGTPQSAPRPTPSTGTQPTPQPSGANPSGANPAGAEPQFLQMLRTMLQSGSVSEMFYVMSLHRWGREHIIIGVDSVSISDSVGMMLSCVQDIL